MSRDFVICAAGISFSVTAQFHCGRGGVDPCFELERIALVGSEEDLTHALHPGVLSTIEERLAELAQQEYAECRAEQREAQREDA